MQCLRGYMNTQFGVDKYFYLLEKVNKKREFERKKMEKIIINKATSRVKPGRLFFKLYEQYASEIITLVKCQPQSIVELCSAPGSISLAIMKKWGIRSVQLVSLPVEKGGNPWNPDIHKTDAEIIEDDIFDMDTKLIYTCDLCSIDGSFHGPVFGIDSKKVKGGVIHLLPINIDWTAKKEKVTDRKATVWWIYNTYVKHKLLMKQLCIAFGVLENGGNLLIRMKVCFDEWYMKLLSMLDRVFASHISIKPRTKFVKEDSYYNMYYNFTKNHPLVISFMEIYQKAEKDCVMGEELPRSGSIDDIPDDDETLTRYFTNLYKLLTVWKDWFNVVGEEEWIHTNNVELKNIVIQFKKIYTGILNDDKFVMCNYGKKCGRKSNCRYAHYEYELFDYGERIGLNAEDPFFL